MIVNREIGSGNLENGTSLITFLSRAKVQKILQKLGWWGEGRGLNKVDDVSHVGLVGGKWRKGAHGQASLKS